MSLDVASIMTAAQWAIAHPWLVFGALLALALAIKLAGLFRTGARRGKKPARLMRSRKQQGQFDPVRTHYSPKQYRRERDKR